MIPLHEDPHFTFRFADDRLIPRFHLEGVEAGRRVSVFRLDPATGERLDLFRTATVGDGGWADLPEPSCGPVKGSWSNCSSRTSRPSPSACPASLAVFLQGIPARPSEGHVALASRPIKIAVSNFDGSSQ